MFNNPQDSTNQAQDPSKLYVGNLVYGITEEELKDMFSQYGEVEECKLITDFRTGRSKGFAFVKFTSEEDATKAMEQLNDQDLQGRKLFIKVAQPAKPRSDRGGFNRGGDRRGGFGGDRRGGFDRNRRNDR
ncbi:MAG: RNA-binding protein [Candidatus Pacebacteria bacterium]|nr:RNA-binding protein [Candidatus Paceibacterota bacterium]